MYTCAHMHSHTPQNNTIHSTKAPNSVQQKVRDAMGTPQKRAMRGNVCERGGCTLAWVRMEGSATSIIPPSHRVLMMCFRWSRMSLEGFSCRGGGCFGPASSRLNEAPSHEARPLWSVSDRKENDHRSGPHLTEKRTITAPVCAWQKRERSPLWSASDRKENDHCSGLCLTENRMITALVCAWQKREQSPLWSASDRKENDHRSGLHLTEKKTIIVLVCIWQKRIRSLLWSASSCLTEKKQPLLWSTSDSPLRSMSDRRRKKITVLVCVWHTALVHIWLAALIQVWQKENNHCSGLRLTHHSDQGLITILNFVWQKRKWSPHWSVSDLPLWSASDERKWSLLWYVSDRKKKKKRSTHWTNKGVQVFCKCE